MTAQSLNLPRPSSQLIVLAESISWQSPTGERVLEHMTLALAAREKVGLVGPNGSGKTTLARILHGDLTPTSGSVSRTGLIARLPQDFTALAAFRVSETLGIHEKLAALARLDAGAGLPGDLDIIDDDWLIEERLAGVFHRLGLVHVAVDRQMGELSGGETTRVVLAGLFLQSPDLIILDEPTNNLDQDSRQALYAAVRAWSGGLLVVSHDRQLLNLMDRIVELSPHGLRMYGGNFDLYMAQRDAEAAAAERDLQHAEKELRMSRLEAQAARQRQERRSSRGRKSREKVGMSTLALNTRRDRSEKTTARLADTFDARISDRSEALTVARARTLERRELAISLAPVDLPASKMVLELDEVSFQYSLATPPLLENFDLRLVGPERVAIVGPNGSGKSTLLRLILGELQATTGLVRRGAVQVGCLDQRASLIAPEQSVLANFRIWNPGLSETDCRLVLARFLFRSDDVHRLGCTLSGGERLRAALACLLASANPPQLLLLDEPTNHLDLASLAHLEQALRGYTGAMLVVSHDQTFLSNIGVDRVVNLALKHRFAGSSR